MLRTVLHYTVDPVRGKEWTFSPEAICSVGNALIAAQESVCKRLKIGAEFFDAGNKILLGAQYVAADEYSSFHRLRYRVEMTSFHYEMLEEMMRSFTQEVPHPAKLRDANTRQVLRMVESYVAATKTDE